MAVKCVDKSHICLGWNSRCIPYHAIECKVDGKNAQRIDGFKVNIHDGRRVDFSMPLLYWVKQNLLENKTLNLCDLIHGIENH